MLTIFVDVPTIYPPVLNTTLERLVTFPTLTLPPNVTRLLVLLYVIPLAPAIALPSLNNTVVSNP